MVNYHDSPVLRLNFSDSGVLVLERQLEDTDTLKVCVFKKVGVSVYLFSERRMNREKGVSVFFVFKKRVSLLERSFWGGEGGNGFLYRTLEAVDLCFVERERSDERRGVVLIRIKSLHGQT